MRYVYRLEIEVDEPVTPEHLARRVAEACSRGALRPGERVRLPDSGKEWIVTDQPAPDPFGDDWIDPQHREEGDPE